MEPDLIDAIDRCRITDFGSDIPQSEAIRRILRDWLAGHGYLTLDTTDD